MNINYRFIVIISLLGAVVILNTIEAQELDPRYADAKYCGVENIKRDADGEIVRDWRVPRDFQRIWACPSTGFTSGACPGHARQHGIPLACGGCDSTHNMIWLAVVIKSGKGLLTVDNSERKIYCRPQILVPMPIPDKLNPKVLQYVPLPQ